MTTATFFNLQILARDLLDDAMDRADGDPLQARKEVAEMAASLIRHISFEGFDEPAGLALMAEAREALIRHADLDG